MPGEYPISKYRKVIKKAEAAKESEIRVRVNSPPFAYAAYAGKLLLQKDFDFVYLNATGAAVSNSIKVIEYLKRHIKDLHISYQILSKEFVDEYEPKIEGLDKVVTKRTVSTLEAVLTTTKGDELKDKVGYMPPSDGDVDQAAFEESMKKYNERKTNKDTTKAGPREGRNRDSKRGGRGKKRVGGERSYNDRRKGSGRDYDDRDGDRRRDDRRDGNRRGGRRDDYDDRDRRDGNRRDGYESRDRNRSDRREDRGDRGDRRREDRGDRGDRRRDDRDRYDNEDRRNNSRRGGPRRGGRGGRGRGDRPRGGDRAERGERRDQN